MYCRYCGKKLEDDVLFCSKCGKPVQENTGKKKQKKRIHKKKRTSKRTTGIIAAALVLVVVVAGFGYKVYIGQDAFELGTGQFQVTREYDTENIKTVPEYVTESGKINKAEDTDFETDPETGLTKIKGGHTGKKVGYVNEKGEEVIPPIYDKVSEPGKNGLIRAEYVVKEVQSGEYEYGVSYSSVINDKVTYFFNENGESVYDYIREFGRTSHKESNATVVREGLNYFLVDREGTRICEESYDYIEDCDEYGNFVVRQGTKQGIINEKGKVILEPSDVKISSDFPFLECDTGVYIVTGDQVSQIITTKGENPVTWQEGQITRVSLNSKRYQINLDDGTTEVRDFDGNVIISAEYRILELEENGFIVKYVQSDGWYEMKTILDHNGNEIASDENKSLRLKDAFLKKEIGSGIIYVTQNDKEGLLTLDGNLSLSCIYDKIDYLSNQQLIVYQKEKRTGVMNLEKEVLWEMNGSWSENVKNIGLMEKTGLLVIESNGKCGLVNIPDGELVLECVYEDILEGNEDTSKWILKKDGKCELWNRRNGTYTEIPCDENYIIENDMGEFFEISIDEDGDGYGDKSGIINYSGSCILSPIYDWITYDEQNEIFYVEIYENDQAGILDKSGQLLVPLETYNEVIWDTNVIFIDPEEGQSRCVDYKGNELYITDGEIDSYLGEGYIIGYEGDKCFLAASDGKDTVKCDYQYIDDISEDGIIMVQNWDDMYGYIDVSGEEIITCTIPYLGEYQYGTIAVRNDEGKFGLMNLQQELLIDYQYELLINSEDRNCLIVVGDDDSWKIIDINNREIVENMHGVEKGADIYIGKDILGGYISTSPENGEGEAWDYCGNQLV